MMCVYATILLKAFTAVPTTSNCGDLMNDMSGTRASRFNIISFSTEYQANFRRAVTEAKFDSDLDAHYRKNN